MMLQLSQDKVLEQKFSAVEAARLLGVHRATVIRKMDAGELAFYRVGDRRVIGMSHLMEYLSRCEKPVDRRKFKFAVLGYALGVEGSDIENWFAEETIAA